MRIFGEWMEATRELENPAVRLRAVVVLANDKWARPVPLGSVGVLSQGRIEAGIAGIQEAVRDLELATNHSDAV